MTFGETPRVSLVRGLNFADLPRMSMSTVLVSPPHGAESSQGDQNTPPIARWGTVRETISNQHHLRRPSAVPQPQRRGSAAVAQQRQWLWNAACAQTKQQQLRRRVTELSEELQLSLAGREELLCEIEELKTQLGKEITRRMAEAARADRLQSQRKQVAPSEAKIRMQRVCAVVRTVIMQQRWLVRDLSAFVREKCKKHSIDFLALGGAVTKVCNLLNLAEERAAARKDVVPMRSPVFDMAPPLPGTASPQRQRATDSAGNRNPQRPVTGSPTMPRVSRGSPSAEPTKLPPGQRPSQLTTVAGTSQPAQQSPVSATPPISPVVEFPLPNLSPGAVSFTKGAPRPKLPPRSKRTLASQKESADAISAAAQAPALPPASPGGGLHPRPPAKKDPTRPRKARSDRPRGVPEETQQRSPPADSTPCVAADLDRADTLARTIPQEEGEEAEEAVEEEEELNDLAPQPPRVRNDAPQRLPVAKKQQASARRSLQRDSVPLQHDHRADSPVAEEARGEPVRAGSEPARGRSEPARGRSEPRSAARPDRQPEPASPQPRAAPGAAPGVPTRHRSPRRAERSLPVIVEEPAEDGRAAATEAAADPLPALDTSELDEYTALDVLQRALTSMIFIEDCDDAAFPLASRPAEAAQICDAEAAAADNTHCAVAYLVRQGRSGAAEALRKDADLMEEDGLLRRAPAKARELMNRVAKQLPEESASVFHLERAVRAAQRRWANRRIQIATERRQLLEPLARGIAAEGAASLTGLMGASTLLPLMLQGPGAIPRPHLEYTKPAPRTAHRGMPSPSSRRERSSPTGQLVPGRMPAPLVPPNAPPAPDVSHDGAVAGATQTTVVVARMPDPDLIAFASSAALVKRSRSK